MSILIDIADAVVAELKGADLGRAVTVEDPWVPQTELAESRTTRLTVLLGPWAGARIDRSTVLDEEIRIIVGVEAKLSAPPDGQDEAEATRYQCRELEAFVDRLRRWWTGVTFELDSGRRAGCKRVEQDAAFDKERLASAGMYETALILVFRSQG